MHIPPNLSFSEAATLPSGITTVGLALYKYLELPFPPLDLLAQKTEVEKKEQEKRFILIYGGSTATGTLAIQFAKLCIQSFSRLSRS